MTKARERWRIAAAALGVLIVAAALAVSFLFRDSSPAARSSERTDRPELLLLSALPIVFPEGFTLDGEQSPAFAALQSRYRVRPISTAHAANLGSQRLLLMAQPQAQTGDALVDLDRWVRGGGRVLLLADPVLQWGSELPLGDVGRPPFAFADTGLLGHWGLRLDAPEQPGPATLALDGTEVQTLSPGSLASTRDQCRVSAGGFVARCTIGAGKATIIADADFIDLEDEPQSGSSANLRLLLSELERLEQ